MAIGLEEVEAHGSLRISLGRENTEEDIDHAITSIKEVVDTLRKMSPLWCSKGE
jgi:cysteine desulfurase